MDDKSITREDALNAINRIWYRCEEIEAHLPEGDPDKTGYKMIADYLTVWKYLSAQPEIKTDENNHYKTGYDQGFVDACKMYEKKQPEPKTGHWIHKHERTPNTWECSNCGYRVNLMDGGIYKFCSACGEKKDGEYG